MENPERVGGVGVKEFILIDGADPGNNLHFALSNLQCLDLARTIAS
jgi:hypothetical protein